jgi:hypothetical protein
MQLGKLILRERLGWKQIQRAARGILEHGVENRSVVAKRLPGRRRCDDDDVAPRQRMSDRFGLVGVQLRDSPGSERIPQAAIERLGERRVSGRYCRQAPQRGDTQIRRIGQFGPTAWRQPLECVCQGGVSPRSHNQGGVVFAAVTLNHEAGIVPAG